uniref:Lipocalin-like domain-containing protein n=1 Tax=Solibacter usitatus (strain Ellin6076) TaxID=234267 RepID=Q023U3_SOLUE
MRLATILIAAALAGPVTAADAFYLGNWKITSALAAPWADSERKPDETERNSLVGKLVTIQPAGITGPRALTCKGPRYHLRDYGADMIFQGMLDEVRRRDPAKDPVKLAAALGFKGMSWKTLETGCANELELHFVDASTAEFGLNNYVYVMKKD